MAGGERLFVGTAAGLLMLGAEAPPGIWREIARALEGRAVIAVVALDGETVLAAPAEGPPLQSFDGGRTWSDAPGAPVEPIGLRVATARGPAPLANPRLMGATAYARLAGRPPALLGAGAGGALLFRSTDGGIHWEPAGGAVAGRVAALAPGALAGSAWAGTDAGQLLRSTDGGATWHEAARLGAPVLCLAATPA